MQYFQDLMPALAGRKQAKLANKAALASESLQDVRIKGRNDSALYGLKTQVAENNRQNTRNVKAFNANRAAQQLNQSLAANQAATEAFERQFGKDAAEGFSRAQAASRGLLGTGLADQINTAQRIRQGAIDEQARNQEAARLEGERASSSALVASAFSNYALSTSLVAQDFTKVKVQRQKVQSFGKALLKDVGRGVATWFGGEYATKALDAIEGYENSYQQGNAMMQGLLNQVYGENAPQLKTASRPQWSAVIGGFSSGGGGWAKGFQTALSQQKDGNNAGMSGKQILGMGQDIMSLFSQGSSGTFTNPGNGLQQYKAGGQGNPFGQASKGFDWQSLINGFGGKLGGIFGK